MNPGEFIVLDLAELYITPASVKWPLNGEGQLRLEVDYPIAVIVDGIEAVVKEMRMFELESDLVDNIPELVCVLKRVTAAYENMWDAVKYYPSACLVWTELCVAYDSLISFSKEYVEAAGLLN